MQSIQGLMIKSEQSRKKLFLGIDAGLKAREISDHSDANNQFHNRGKFPHHSTYMKH